MFSAQQTRAQSMLTPFPLLFPPGEACSCVGVLPPLFIHPPSPPGTQRENMLPDSFWTKTCCGFSPTRASLERTTLAVSETSGAQTGQPVPISPPTSFCSSSVRNLSSLQNARLLYIGQLFAVLSCFTSGLLSALSLSSSVTTAGSRGA